MGDEQAHSGRWRPILSAVSLMLAAVALVVAPVAWWARDVVLDSDTFTATVAPVAADPLVQDQVVQLVQQQVSSHINFVPLLEQWVPTALAQRFGDQANQLLADQVDERVGALVRSDTFAQVWQTAARVTHDRLLGFLNHDSALVDYDETGVVTLDLQPLIDRAVQAIPGLAVPAEAKVVLAQLLPNLPAVPTTVVVGQIDALPTITSGLGLLNAVAGWVLWVALIAAAVGLWLARRRWRAVVMVALGAAVAWVILRIVMSAIVPGVATGDLLQRVIELVTSDLMTTLLVWPVVAAVIAVAAAGVGIVLDRRGPA